MSRQKKPKGKEAFMAYYRTLFSVTRDADEVFEKLSTATPPVLRFATRNEAQLRTLWEDAGLPWKTLTWFSNALLWPTNVELGTELPGLAEKLFYPMNASSLIPVLALNAQPGDHILDACAAPGGKALFIADILNGEGALTANDASANRRIRLRDVLSRNTETSVNILGTKGETIFRTHQDAFDRILTDAPCSSEKHVLASEKHIKEWSLTRIKQLQERQVSLLSGLIHALKPGGTMVYSTCALTPEENEAVVGRFLNKKSDIAELIPWTLNVPGEPGIVGDYKVNFPSENVRRIWPDGEYLDPMFVAVFKRK